MSHSRREDVDGDIRFMLKAFAGAAQPSPSLPRRRHGVTLRAVVILAAAVLALGLAVPGSLALLGNFSETPQQFVNDPSQPLNARKAIERFVADRDKGAYTLTGVQQVVSADTPDGEYRVYALTFAEGVVGMAILSSTAMGVVADWGPPASCPDGWALQAGLSFLERPGKTPLYVTGRVSSAVASLDVLYPDGHSTPAAVGNGYFLAWVNPIPGAVGSVDNVSPTTTLVARDAAGNELGHLTVRGGGSIPRLPGASAQAPSCG